MQNPRYRACNVNFSLISANVFVIQFYDPCKHCPVALRWAFMREGDRLHP